VSDRLARPYEQLAEMAQRERALIGDRRLEELDQLAAERATLIASLPAKPPAWAMPALEQAALIHRRVTIEMTRLREAILLELAGVERARRMASGYAPVRRPGVRVDASA
jgi:hypothetical protein